MDKEQSNQKVAIPRMNKLNLMKHIKSLISDGEVSSTEALELLQSILHDTHDDPADNQDLPDAPGQYYGRVPIKASFLSNLPFDIGYDDEEDTPPGRSVLTYKGIFYNFNSTTLYPEGREAFMSQMGIKVMGQQSVVVNFTVPVMGNGWNKIEYPGSPSSKQTVTDPFARWQYDVRSFQQSLSVLTFESNYAVPEGCVPVRECLGAYVTVNRSLETLNNV